MLTLENLNNIRVFLMRASMTGQEAVGWVQTMAAVEAAIAQLSAPKLPETPAA